MKQEIRKADGAVTAELTGACGMLDLELRRLVPDPKAWARVWSLAADPELLGC